MFEIRTIHLTGYFSVKAEGSLNQNKIPKKSAMALKSLQLHALSGLCLFCSSICVKSAFAHDILDELL